MEAGHKKAFREKIREDSTSTLTESRERRTQRALTGSHTLRGFRQKTYILSERRGKKRKQGNSSTASWKTNDSSEWTVVITTNKLDKGHS